jgi:signal transduction histidine kinase
VSSQPLVAADSRSGLERYLTKLRQLPSGSGILPLYAGLVLAFGWAYTAVRIDADREQTLQTDRNRLSAVAAALDSATVAMLNDGVGAAVAGANELEPLIGRGAASNADVATTLDQMITGGQYVRSLFIVRPGAFVRSGRNGSREISQTAPGWFTAPQAPVATDTWVGAPIADPDHPTDKVVPVARRVFLPGRQVLWAGGLFDFAATDALGGRVGSFVGSAGILTTSGLVLGVVPRTRSLESQIGLDISSSPLFRQVGAFQTAGVVAGYAPTYGMNMMFAHERIRDYPIRVFAAESMDILLEPWRNRRQLTLEAAAAASLFLILGTGLITRNIVSRRRLQTINSTRLARQKQQSLALLKWANKVGPSAGELSAVLANLCLDALNALSVEHVSIWLLDRDAQLLKCHARVGNADGSAQAPAVQVMPISGSLAALRRERVIELPDEPGGADLEQLVASAFPGRNPKSLIAAAIRNAGEVLGVLLVVQFSAQRRWEADEVAFVGGTADQIAQVLGASEREQMLEDLRVLTGELMRSQDEERRRIGRELHDSTGQILVALELDLGRLMSGAQLLGPEKQSVLETCARLAHQCSSEIRTASYLLHPPLLDELGLLSALRWLTDGLRQRSNIEIRMELPVEMARMPREQEMALFRVAQEALTNVHRHSASPWVAVRLASAADNVQLEIEDEGRGLSAVAPRQAAESKAPLGVGLAGMRERMRQLGGSLRVEFRSSGTLIQATLPMPPQKPGVRT